ncbi:hypothetical protein MS2017_2111 [Bathymodiolus thermophilus thioautotrophic gill symbiont]|uniref:Uncharacterized protein n=1 Tax=Bathymodiolus thermophilus thioautotrophic gill symbiont TaxID=2360 RepID=A0A3G3IQ81_9GAMM|nr:hypothetical protein MS2017_2111 [Bathymodiolus thermophilus thioautotrophic gill symbiont]
MITNQRKNKSTTAIVHAFNITFIHLKEQTIKTLNCPVPIGQSDFLLETIMPTRFSAFLISIFGLGWT